VATSKTSAKSKNASPRSSGVSKSEPTTDNAPTPEGGDRPRNPVELGGKNGEERSSWEPLKTESLSWRIANRVRAALFDGKLAPGEFLGTETSLAEQFGVSRMAARDALRSLAASGIVDVRQGARGGAWISQGNLELLTDAMAIQLALVAVSEAEVIEMQAGIEAMAAELAAERATPEDIAHLRTLLASLAAAVNDTATFPERALRFHEAVVEAAHNRAMLAQFRAMKFHLETTYRRQTTVEIAKRAVAAHKRLLTLIEAGDGDAAYTHMHERMDFVRRANEPLPPRR
jgi:GntR family transcriptional regulator, transcriptional repressor for pyruvate dehydrogenase complex